MIYYILPDEVKFGEAINEKKRKMRGGYKKRGKK